MRPILPGSILLAFIGPAFAQPPVAPTPEAVGSPRGKNWDDYNITNSFEAGYRFADVTGDLGKYRSDVNYLNGIRLLSSSFAMHSKDGHGGLFDEVLLNTQGLGNDPYEFASLRIQKNKLYRYDLLWRLDDYYNPAFPIAEARHFRNTSRTQQDQDIVLFPQSKIQFRFGYSRNNQEGPGLSTVLLFDARGDVFTPFMNIRRLWNEFRVGNDIVLHGFKFSWLHAWDNFKEDSTFAEGPSPGANPLDTTTLTSFNRIEPNHGNSPFWRGNLHGERKSWAANARITYVGAQRGFVLDENAVGTSRTPINRQTLVTGNATRPTTAGDFSLSIFPSDRFTVVNNTSFYSTRISGNAAYNEITNSIPSQIVYFQFLGIRTITNSTNINYRVSPTIGLYGAYRYSTRQIRSVEDLSFPQFPGPPEGVAFAQDNNLNTIAGGLRLQALKLPQPLKPLTVLLEGEVSRADRPITPLSDKDFHALRARLQYRAKDLLLSAQYRQDYNANSVTLSTHSARSRNYSVDASWTARSWFTLDAGYSKLHLDTVSGIAFFASAQLINGLDSIYISNVHAANFGARFALRKKADLYVGYTITKDTGDGRPAPVPPGTTDPAVLLLSPAQTFPLSFQSPLARLSVRLSPKVRWNAGWQFYNYHEEFQLWLAPQNYHANTGYTSLLWSF